MVGRQARGREFQNSALSNTAVTGERRGLRFCTPLLRSAAGQLPDKSSVPPGMVIVQPTDWLHVVSHSRSFASSQSASVTM